MKTEWRTIPGSPDYLVSNTGIVKSKHRVILMKNGVKKTIHERILSQSKAGSGYLIVHLGNKKEYVHRLVALAFISKQPLGCEVNHRDENKENNCAENLEWVTKTENLRYGTRNERIRISSIRRCRPVTAFKDGKIVCEFASIHEAERAGFNRSRISACCRNANDTHKGLYWQFSNGGETNAIY